MNKKIITFSISILFLGSLLFATQLFGLSIFSVPQGGSGTTAFPANTLIVSGASTTAPFTATTSPTIGYFTATSTTATSTLVNLLVTGTADITNLIMGPIVFPNSTTTIPFISSTGIFTNWLNVNDTLYATVANFDYLTATSTTFNSTLPNFLSTKSTTTSATSTNLFASIFAAPVAQFGYLFATSTTDNSTLPNFLSTRSTTTNATSTSLFSYLLSSPVANFGYLVATSTSATSTFAGGLTIETNGFVYDYSSNNVGIGTDNPVSRFEIKGSNSAATLGSTNLLTADGTFAASTGWTVGAGWTIGSGVATHATGNTAALSGTSDGTSQTTIYEVRFTLTVTTAGDGLTVTLGGAENGTLTITTGTKRLFFRPDDTTGTLAFTPGDLGTFVGTIDDVLIYKIIPSTADISIYNSDGIYSPLELRGGGSALVNTFLGFEAGKNTFSYSGTTGRYNVFLGYAAGLYNSIGSFNFGLGSYALEYNVTGSYNATLGQSTLLNNVSGSYQIAIGTLSLAGNTTGSYSQGYGHQAGRFISDGITSNTNSTRSMFFGASTKALQDNGINEIVFGDSATGLGSNTIVLGNTDIATTALRGYVGIGTTSPNNKLDINGNFYTSGSGFFGGAVIATSTLTVNPLTSALIITGADGLMAEYSGTSCTNQFVRSLSVLGAATCSAVDISSDTNLTAGAYLTLTGDDLSVDDNFLFNTGDIGTGVYDFGGATSLEIPNDAAPTVDATGEIAVDTTANQLIYYGTAEKVISPQLYPAFTYATSTAFTGTTTIPLGTAFVAETWSAVQCFTDIGTLNVSFYDGTNRMTMLIASTTVGTVGLITNNTFTAAEKRYVDIGTPLTAPTKISCTISKSIDKQ